MPAGTGLGDSADQVGPSQVGNSSTALLQKKMHTAAGSHATCHWHPAAKGNLLPCIAPAANGDRASSGGPSAKGYNPPTISPVWLPVNHLQNEKQRVDEDTQQNEQQDDEQDVEQDERQDDLRDDQQDDWQNYQQHNQQEDQQDGLHHYQHDDEDSRQDMLPLQEGGQPSAKRHKGEVQGVYGGAATYQQQVILPLPPLRFFVRRADEFSSVYQPRSAALVPDES